MKQNKNLENKLVYSSDGSHLKLCKKCGSDPCLCQLTKPAQATIIPAKITLKIRLEKNSRGGKMVTVIFDFPHHPDYFIDLLKKLKAHCGTGGTFKNESHLEHIELQGDQRNKITPMLLNLGFKIKHSGG